ncbi:MAG: peptidylprolyl isomerase [bacterium]
MKKILVLGLAICFGILEVCVAKILDKTIAKVNGEAIFLSEFQKNTESVIALQKRLIPVKEQSSEWILEQKKAVLDQMIDDKLLLQEANRRKIKVNRRDLEEGLNQIKKRFEVDQNGQPVPKEESEKLFREELKKEELIESKFEERVRDQLSVMKLIDEEVKLKVKPPTEDELKVVFNNVQKIIKGEPVADLDSEDELEYQQVARFFNEAVAERITASHILIMVDKDASMKDKSDALKKIRNIRKQINEGGDFASLAEKYSDDTQSAKRGGLLGPFIKGMMVPEFDEAAFKLNVGEVSDIVETEFGYHIIKVEEKRAAQKLRYDDVKDRISDFAFRLSAKKRYNFWLQSLKDHAKIEILEAELK